MRWRQVCDVAAALLDRETLTGDELRQVMFASIDADMADALAAQGGAH